MTLQAQGLRGLTRRLPPGPADLRRTAGVEDAVRRLLLGGVMPLWVGAGLADWYLHRRTRIEETAGPRESAPALADVRRNRGPSCMATFLLTALHWGQAKALAGQDMQAPRFRVRLKRRDPLSPAARVTLLAAVTVFGVLPYAEELLRCWRANPRLRPLPEPAEPATDTQQPSSAPACRRGAPQ
jgi:hypothetical protein